MDQGKTIFILSALHVSFLTFHICTIGASQRSYKAGKAWERILDGACMIAMHMHTDTKETHGGMISA